MTKLLIIFSGLIAAVFIGCGAHWSEYAAAWAIEQCAAYEGVYDVDYNRYSGTLTAECNTGDTFTTNWR